MFEGSNSNESYNLVRLEPKRLFGELIICDLLFSKSLHDLIILCLVTTQKAFHHLVPNARTHVYFIQSMLLICITHIQDEVVQLNQSQKVYPFVICFVGLTPLSLCQPIFFVNHIIPTQPRIGQSIPLFLKCSGA